MKWMNRILSTSVCVLCAESISKGEEAKYYAEVARAQSRDTRRQGLAVRRTANSNI